MLNSKYFILEEFRCHSGAAYPAEWIDDRLNELCGVLDIIRERWGGPLTVVSGYRDPVFNKKLAEASAARNGVSGVASQSQHIFGRAADIRPLIPTKERVALLHRFTLKLWDDGRIPAMGGLGLYPGWIHVDTRPHVALARWGGQGMGEEK